MIHIERESLWIGRVRTPVLYSCRSSRDPLFLVASISKSLPAAPMGNRGGLPRRVCVCAERMDGMGRTDSPRHHRSAQASQAHQSSPRPAHRKALRGGLWWVANCPVQSSRWLAGNRCHSAQYGTTRPATTFIIEFLGPSEECFPNGFADGQSALLDCANKRRFRIPNYLHV